MTGLTTRDGCEWGNYFFHDADAVIVFSRVHDCSIPLSGFLTQETTARLIFNIHYMVRTKIFLLDVHSHAIFFITHSQVFLHIFPKLNCFKQS